jgi:hypothetical protein
MFRRLHGSKFHSVVLSGVGDFLLSLSNPVTSIVWMCVVSSADYSRLVGCSFPFAVERC